MQKKRPALLAILMMTAALAGCISEDTSDLDAQIEDLDTQNTELTQTVAERDVAISELEATVSGHESNITGLEAANALMEGQRNSLLVHLIDSQEFANQTLELAEAMNETIAGITVCEGDSVEVNDDGYCVAVETINCFQAGFCDEAHSMGMGNGTSLCGDATLAECATEEQRADYYAGASALQATGYHMPQWLHVSLVGNMCGSN